MSPVPLFLLSPSRFLSFSFPPPHPPFVLLEYDPRFNNSVLSQVFPVAHVARYHGIRISNSRGTWMNIRNLHVPVAC